MCRWVVPSHALVLGRWAEQQHVWLCRLQERQLCPACLSQVSVTLTTRGSGRDRPRESGGIVTLPLTLGEKR